MHFGGRDACPRSATRGRCAAVRVADGQPIEYQGIEPDEYVEALPEDVARGLNTCIRCAEQYLLEEAAIPAETPANNAGTG